MEENNQKYTPYTESLMFSAQNLARACKEVTRRFYKKMGFEISQEEYSILEVILLNPGVIQHEIAQRLFMQRSYVCKTLIKLEEAGYIRKETALRGKRKTVIKLYLTEDGEKIYNKIRGFINIEIAQYPDDRRIRNIKVAEYLRALTADINERYNLKL